ncbi:amino acid adenylation domain-containing protein [Variovorax sp. J22P240]|uniref:non-ribosomal peptide synthetase n=1 Tax=Variovorax sp. J22P240 TaxID=3053514 RepID=UPI0025750CF7|nr:non-ribosomal peptide synthetase [Variovorax sp. J22P240]MDM0001919.1 amino acid adenylation domain-containing protein [Variovorax sp. J22P240]
MDAAPNVTSPEPSIPTSPGARRRILARKLQQRAQAGSPTTLDAAEGAPLSFPQEGLWFLDQMAAGGAAYNIHSATRYRGALNVELLERSLQRLLARHDSLRTEFHAAEQAPVQKVIPVPVALQRFQLQRVQLEAATEGALRERIGLSIARPFDLSSAPLLRAELFCIAPDDHVLVLVVHHIVADGWSMSVIRRELAQCYARGAEDADMAAPPLAFADYVSWQRQRFERDGLQTQAAYWREHLRELETLHLPTDRPRPSQTSHAGRTLELRIEPALVAALRTLVARHDATPFMGLLAAFNVLLMRYTGQTDIAVGVPLAARHDVRLRDMVGYFANTVVMRNHLEGQSGFIALLKGVRQTTLAALAHQDLPFDRLVAELNPERDASRNPLYQVSFALENFPHRKLELAGLASEQLAIRAETSKFDLSLVIVESDGGFEALFEYRTDLFEVRTIAQMAAHFIALLREIVDDPGKALDRLPLMDAKERHRVLVEWNQQVPAVARELPVHALFRAQARATPEAIALRFGPHNTSYRELDLLSDRLAHELRTLGVGPEMVVGLCMKRCTGLAVALLGIFKAGGVLLPLDPGHPVQRLRAMLEDSRPAVVLAQSTLVDRLREIGTSPATKYHVLADDGGPVPVDPMADLPDPIRQDHLAYLIYTSGSTGTPKAAQLMHRGLSNHVLWMTDALGLSASDRVLQKTSISFDASLWEFLSPLCRGATLVIAQPDVHEDMHLLAAAIRDNAISVVQFVPSELRVMLDGLASPDCPSLRYVLSGGEAMDRALALSFRQRLPGVRLGNFYGPTEATVDSAWYEIGTQLPDRPIVPIGRPIANTQLYVLDARLEPQPVNVAGELYVGGIGVARGYQNRPALSAERFLPNPFRPGETLYRTGDSARWLHDGVVEFIGRNDDQVKLRGFRIELGEIESALAACDPVQMSAVLLRDLGPDHKELVAYVVLKRPADAAFLRSALKKRLPDYMIPGAFVFLPELPRLANGKLDRGRLPGPDSDASAPHQLAPRSPIESTLLDIWSAVLGKSGFGVRANFFDLGGHSLLATQIVSRIRSTVRVELPLRQIFEHPTIEELAQQVGALGSDPDGDEAAQMARIEAVPRTGPLPVSFSQRRMWVLNQMDPKGAAYNMRDTMRLRGPLDTAALRGALDHLVARHEAFRSTFEFGDTEPRVLLGEIHGANLVEIDLSRTPAAERESEFHRQAAHIAAEPFDLAAGPLHRFILLRLDAQDHVLALVMHHIIGDDWSWGILLRELQDLYAALLRGHAAPTPPRALDFADYASWQRQHIDDQMLARQTHYWLGQLAGMSPLNLSSDTAVAQRLSSRGDRIRRQFPEGWLAGIQRFSGGLGLTPFMTLLAAFQALLARYCGQEDIVVGTPIAGRMRIESEEVVGSLVNTLALRSQVRPAQSFTELTQQVRETCLSAFTHQDIPFDYLMDRLRQQESGARAPEVRVMFNVVNTPRKLPQFDGLDVDFVPLNLHATQFDLSLTIDTEVELAMSLGYSTELFAPATAQAMLDNFMHLLERFIQQPERPLHEHAAASPEELARLATWNRTDIGYPRDLTVHGLLDAQRGASGTALVQVPGETLDYRELWSRVDRLAHLLRGAGVRRGCLVGLCVQRTPAMVVAQLAILRAGGAYVPLDPAYPLQRLHDMAVDAALTLMVTEQGLASLWQDLAMPTLLLDQAQAELMAQPATALPPDAECDARPADPAYVIYTSGSTGKPKGVVVPHQAVVNFLLSMQREPGLGPGDVLVAVTTLSFDIAVLELLLPLLAGATVVLATREQTVDGEALRSLIDQAGATVMQATPATWRMLIDAGWTGSASFKALVGGESLSPAMAQQLSARTGEVWNLYGPTETTVWSTCWKVPPEPQTISIGRPIANTRIYVLDAQGRRCPAGVSGEIFIGGDGVTSGYLNRLELTAERFIPDPFSADPHARLYRTGDRGRWRHDGLLEHQGRLDFQVKVRGHRIELGEIESSLQAHPDVSQSLVVAREDRPGDVRLVAYLVLREGAAGGAEFKDHLRVSLPDYMLPQHYVVLDALPLLPNGKINRHALPAPRIESRASLSAGDAPSTPAEMALAGIWGEILGMDSGTIARRDNFFDLGGDSLQVSRVVIAFHRTGGVRLEARRMIFETLGQLAGGVELRAHDVAPEEEPTKQSKGWFRRLFRS